VLENNATIAAFGMIETSLGWQDARGRRPRLMVGDDLEPGEKNSLDEVERNKAPPTARRPADGRWSRDCLGHRHHDHAQLADPRLRTRGQGARRRASGYTRMGFEAQALARPGRATVSRGGHRAARAEDAARAARCGPRTGFDLNYQNDPQPDADMTFWTEQSFRYRPVLPESIARVLYIDPAETTGSGLGLHSHGDAGARPPRGRRPAWSQVAWGRWTDPEIRTPHPRHLVQAVRAASSRRCRSRATAAAPPVWTAWRRGRRVWSTRWSATMACPKFYPDPPCPSGCTTHARSGIWTSSPSSKPSYAQAGRAARTTMYADATVAGALEWAFPVPKSK
jgi:hypothetical protein